MLSDDVLDFLRNAIGSIWALEQLLLMHQDATRSWSVEDLTRELRSNTAIVTSILLQFATVRLVREIDSRYVYGPSSNELNQLVARVADSYARFPFAVKQAILTTPNRQIQLFADAFRIKKKE